MEEMEQVSAYVMEIGQEKIVIYVLMDGLEIIVNIIFVMEIVRRMALEHA